MVASELFKKGSWTEEEDALLLEFVKEYGAGNWNTAHLFFPDLRRSGKSCRVRFYSQLHYGIRHAFMMSSLAEEGIIVPVLGNQWYGNPLCVGVDNSLDAQRRAHLLNEQQLHVGTDNGVSVQRRAQMPNEHQRRAQMPNEHQVHAPTTNDLISVPTSAAGLSVLPPQEVARMGMHNMWVYPASTSGIYTAVGAGGGTPMNDLAAGTKEHGPGAGIMSTAMQTGPILVTGNGEVVSFMGTQWIAVPTSSYPEWVMQASLAAQNPQERPSGTGRLPSVQRSSESVHVPSVQELLESSELPSVQQPFMSFQSLEGSKLPSVQEPFQSLLPNSDLPTVQAQCNQADIAHQPGNIIMTNNDPVEAKKLTCHGASSSNFGGGSNAPVNRVCYHDSYLNTLFTGIEAGHQASITSSSTFSPALSSASVLGDLPYDRSSAFTVRSSKQQPNEENAGFLSCNMSNVAQQLLPKREDPGAGVESQMMNGIDRDIVSIVLDSDLWSSMPAAYDADESFGN